MREIRSGTIDWAYAGIVGYAEGLALQESARRRVERGMGGILIFLEHKPVITTGRFANPQNVLLGESELRRRGVELYKSSRGGDATFHGPGQIVAYPIISLRSFNLGARAYVNMLEQVIIGALRAYGIEGGRIASYPGVWVGGERKIASIGVAVKNGITTHGFALNVGVDLGYFSLIIPCGIRNAGVTSMREILGREIHIGEMSERLASELAKNLGVSPLRRQLREYPCAGDENRGEMGIPPP
ncbi:MAG: lipoyl(octanoyl) transferase LipB [Deltaproteobacteria bacterium]